jgi:hypothetical protein
MPRFAVLVAALAFAAAAAAQPQFTVVIPAGMATAEGSGSNAFPWGRGGGGLLHQCIYDSSHFTSQGIVVPIRITGLKWRPNAGSLLLPSTYSTATVSLSTSPVDQGATTSTFASNRGPDFLTVYNGPVSFNLQPAQPGPTPFGISVPFTTAFFYDPAAGDLNIECELPVQSFSGGMPQLDVHTTAGQALASRVFLSVGYPGAVGTREINHGVVVEVTYQLAVGSWADFTANVTGGASPLAVQFTDASTTSAPTGIATWAWDFDGDSVVDSTLQNPAHTYTQCGTYTVSLTVTDGVNPPSTKTRTGYIATDRIVADFTTQVVGPLTVQFTDTSSMPATSWAWDFNGDTVPDSTAPSPTWTFASASPANVTLTVTRLCAPPAQVTKPVVPAQVLATNLATNNGGASLWTLYFDVDVLNPAGVGISAFDSISSTTGTPFTVDVYLKQGTHVGFEYTAAPWTRVATASGTSNPVANQPSAATFPLPLYVPQGSYGIALRYLGIAPLYVTLPAAATVGNADLSLTFGSSAATTVGPFQGTTTFVNTPRMWSGTLYYGTNNVTGGAGYGFFGQGCPGALGHVGIANTTLPRLGTTLQTTLTNLQNDLAVLVVGLSNTAWGAAPLPLDLGIVGAPGCPLRVSVDGSATVAGTAGTATWSFAIPNLPALNGFKVYSQAASLDSTNAFGFVLSNAYGWVVGN